MSKRLHEAINTDVAYLAAFNFEKLGQRLHNLLEIDLTTGWREDSLPKQVVGASPTTSRAPTNNCEECEGTFLVKGAQCDNCGPTARRPVEAAAQGRQRDEVHATVRLVIQMITEAKVLMGRAMFDLDNLDKLRNDNTATSTEPGCRAIERVGGWEPIYRRTVIDGDVWPLGEWAYKFLLRLNRLPNEQECRAHLRGERIMVKAG